MNLCNISFYLFICLYENKSENNSIGISTSLPLQYAEEGIRAGFPSQAQDYLEQKIIDFKATVKFLASDFYSRVTSVQ